jgi:prepilin-type N-terminal cleavage/methylation domain-containing protein
MPAQNQKQHERKGPCGFTILEMLLAVVLIVLIAGVGGSVCWKAYKKMMVEKSTRDFVLAAKYARSIAIERQCPCKLEFDSSGRKFILTIEQFNEQTEQTEHVILRDSYFKPVEFADGIKFEKIQIEGSDHAGPDEQRQQSEVIFSPDGRASAVVVQIGDGQNHMTVSIQAATAKAMAQAGIVEHIENKTIDLDEL